MKNLLNRIRNWFTSPKKTEQVATPSPEPEVVTLYNLPPATMDMITKELAGFRPSSTLDPTLAAYHLGIQHALDHIRRKYTA